MLQSARYRKMKIVQAAIYLVIFATVLTSCKAYLSDKAMKKTTQMLKNVCSKKYPVEDEIFVDIKKGIFPEDNNNLKCYFSCVFKTMQLVSSKGIIEKKIFKDKMAILAPPAMTEVVTPGIDNCAEKDKDELCQSSYNFIKCSYGVDPKILDYLPI